MSPSTEPHQPPQHADRSAQLADRLASFGIVPLPRRGAHVDCALVERLIDQEDDGDGMQSPPAGDPLP